MSIPHVPSTSLLQGITSTTPLTTNEFTISRVDARTNANKRGHDSVGNKEDIKRGRGGGHAAPKSLPNSQTRIGNASTNLTPSGHTNQAFLEAEKALHKLALQRENNYNHKLVSMELIEDISDEIRQNLYCVNKNFTSPG